MNVKEWLLLIILSILWGSSFFLIKVVIEELKPLSLVLGRIGLVVIALIAVI